MKKLLAILAVCFVMVSCQWWHETFDSTEECVTWYLDELYDAAVAGDVDEFRDLAADCNAYQADKLDEAFDAGYNYGSRNPEKIQKIVEFAYEHSVVIY